MPNRSEHRCRIIACDPGKATGFAVFDLFYRPDDEIQWVALQKFHLEMVAVLTIPWDDRLSIMHQAIDAATDDLTVPVVVVNEHFTVTRLTMQSQDTQSLDVTGSLKAILELLGIRHTYLEQLPSSAKLLITNRVIEEVLGINCRPISDHGLDAIRHAATWAVAYVHNKVQITHHPVVK